MTFSSGQNYGGGSGQGQGFDSAAVGIVGGVVIGLLIVGYVLSLLFWFAGQLSGLVTGHWPASTPSESVKIFIAFFSNLGNPAAAWPKAASHDVGPAILVYLFFLIFLAPIAWGATAGAQYAIRFRRRRENRTFRLGFADGGEVRKLLSAHAVIKKAKSVRPSYKGKRNINPQDVGFFLGKDTRSRRRLFCSVEDVMLVVAPPRQGKDVHFCIPNIIDAPGSCVATTTRADMFAATVTAREKFGEVWVFDPNDMTNWPSQLRWSPVNGCHEPLVALNRAAAFVSGAGVGEGVQNASYWTGVATAILRCYFLAAATSGRTITDVVRWSTQPTNPEPIQILRKMEQLGRAPQGWAGELESGASADGETRGNMWSGVRRALDCFADPKVLAACSPGPDEVFDVARFVSGRNTLYVLGKEKKNGSVAPLVTAMMEDIFDQVRKIASRMPNSRIDPPMTVELNEVAHIAPMPNLPGYMGDSGGFSISLHVYLQSLGQARGKWGNDEAAVMWDTAAIRVVMGGSGYVNDLEDISRLMGEVDEKTKSVSRGAGGKSTSYSKQKRRVLTVDELRTLEFGTAVIIARAARPVEARLTPYFRRKDAKEISAGQARVGKIIAAGEAGDVDALAPTGLLAPTGALAGAGSGGAGSNGGFGGGGAFDGGGSGMGTGTLTLPPGAARPSGMPPADGFAQSAPYGADPGYGSGSGPYQPQSLAGQAYVQPGQQPPAPWESTAPAEPPRGWGVDSSAVMPTTPAPEPTHPTPGPSGWGGRPLPSPEPPQRPTGQTGSNLYQPGSTESTSGWQGMFQPAQRPESPQPSGTPQTQLAPASYQAPEPAGRPQSVTYPQVYQPQAQPPVPEFANGDPGQYGAAPGQSPSQYGVPQTAPQGYQGYVAPPAQPEPEPEAPANQPRIASGWGPVRRTDQE